MMIARAHAHTHTHTHTRVGEAVLPQIGGPVCVFSHRTLKGGQASDVLKCSELRRACAWASPKASLCAA